MKFYASTFEDYLNSVEKYNLHPELTSIWQKMPTNGAVPPPPPPNMIFYGPPGVGKYTQVLRAIQKYGGTEGAAAAAAIKHQKKISIQFNKQVYSYNLSNIHYEIDMALLGCNSKLLWHDIFVQIVDIVSVRNTSPKIGIIVCKNFHAIHNELLEIFYSYMQQYNSTQYSQIRISFILITENISFIPTNILNSCHIVNIARPSREQYAAALHVECGMSFEDAQSAAEDLADDQPKNLKEFFSLERTGNHNTDISTRYSFYLICNTIIKHMMECNKLSFTEFRDAIYDVFIYNLDVAECVWYIVSHVIKTQKIEPEVISAILLKSYTFLQYFNNNYRPIYHLESFFIYIIIHVFIRSP